jgi:phenylalanyl-tRNA synthetase alpha chain
MHPITSLVREANRIFFQMGFTFSSGPLLESEWYNFDALNVPKDHPSRDMQDTFFIKDMPGHVLRTHTSPVQVRYMESQIQKGVNPPYRVIVPGKIFRNEATDMTHEAEFFQIEGLVVEPGATLATLKGTLSTFLGTLMGGEAGVRFRPSFFPFTEPSLEVDMRLTGKEAPEKLRDKWIEIGGAGMVHPTVLKNAGVDASTNQGFAFGMGLDRLAMLKWGIDDVRYMHSADLRFINQF